MGFTDHEKTRIKHFLAYPDWRSLAASIQLGYPAGSQPLYLVEDAFNRLAPGGITSSRADLCECEDIESQLRDARKRLRFVEAGKVKTNPREMQVLHTELVYWTLRLASDLGVVPNPYAASEWKASAAGGINAKVG